MRIDSVARGYAQAVAESLAFNVSAPGLAHGKRAFREHAMLPELADKYR